MRSSRAFNTLATSSRSARQRLDGDSSVEALHDAGLLALRLRDSIRTGLDDAARFLTRARIADSSNAPVLNDLAVVQLERGDREQSIEPFLVALDAADRALASDSTLLPALFNRALTLERLHLLTTAAQAWRRYGTVERDFSWKREAQRHLDAVTRESTSAPLPQGGRDTVFKLLGDWGHAVGRHDETQAVALLDAVHRVLATFDTVRGDQSLRFTVALVDSQVRAAGRSPSGRKTLERLAAAHADLVDGHQPYLNAMYDEALVPLQRADRELHELGSAAGAWASLYLASTEINRGEYDSADERLQRIIAEAFPQEPALLGKAIWTRGVVRVRRGNFEAATSYYRAAAPYMARSNEPDNEGAISFLISESLSSAGQYAAGRVEAYRALRLLAPYRKSIFLSPHLGTVATFARADSLPFAVLSVMDEVLSVALETKIPGSLGLTYRARASDLAAIGRRDSALAELAIGLKAIEPLSGLTRERYRADLELVRGQVERSDNPRVALPILAAVANDYRRLGVDWNRSVALYEAAMAARDAGDSIRARAWLSDAIAQIERQQMTFDESEGRAAFYETFDNIFDAIIDLELRAGHPDSAFFYLERERAAAKLAVVQSSSSRGGEVAPSLEAIRRRLPAGMAFVEFALLDDSAVAWVASRRGTSHHMIAAGRKGVAALVQQFRRESSIPEPRDGDARSELFDLLLKPLARDLDGVQQLAVVADRELVGLPFAALWDGATRQYVVERYRVQTEPSAAFLLAAMDLKAAPGRERTALVVGNPLLDTTSTSLPPLPGAEREAARVAAVYPKGVRLIGSAARRDSVLSLLKTATVFHFAGHAVFNDDRPELSYLAMGESHRGDHDGALRAREIGALRLSNLRLVVLSACQTLSPRTSRTGGGAGLTSSFLRAGAPAIVSTLWDVSDDVTGPLLTALHQRVAAGFSVAEALRLAQLDALKAQPGQHAAPATWAAFIYAGP